MIKTKKHIKILSIFLAFCTCFMFACNGKSDLNDDAGLAQPGEETYSTFASDKENGYFVKDNRTEYVIVIPKNYTENEEYAANELKRYINITTSSNINIRTDEGLSYSENKKYISVGKTVFQKSADLSDVDYENLKTGGFFIKNFGSLYVLDSGCAEGVLYSVYEFLNVFFGVEFLTYDDSYIPTLKDVKATEINLISTPAFDIRDYYYYAVWFQGLTYGAKLRMNSSSFKADSKVGGENNYAYYGYYYDYNGTTSFVQREGHTIQALLAVDAYLNGYNSEPYYKTSANGANSNYALGYFAIHPEWYAYNPTYDRINSRGYSQEEICYSNGLDDNGNYIYQDRNTPDENKNLITKMAEICANMVENEVSENAVYLMLGHADYYAQCQCQKCQAAYKKYGGFGGTTIVWGNAVIKETKRLLKEDGCTKDVKFVMFAYSKSIDAPVIWNNDGTCRPVSDKVIADKDMVIKMAYRNCVYHSLWDEDCEQNQILRDRFKGWSTISDSFVIWDYTCCFTDYLYYMPNFGTIQDNYKYYQTIGVKHLLSQGCPSEYNYYDSNLHCYVMCKLMWNPNQDVNALIKKFNKLYFGEKYAEYVNLYRDVFENYYAIKDAEEEHGFHASTTYELDFTNPATYSLTVLKRAADIIQQAIDEVNNDITLNTEEREILIKKLRSVKITPQYMMLDLQLLTDEDEIRKVAIDFFESIEILKLTYRCEGNLVANSFEEMKKSYNI